MNKLIKKAFTLIELLVVIAIIGILSGLIVVSIGGMTQKATIAKAQVFSNSLRNSLMMNIIGEWKFDGATSERTAIDADVIDSWGGKNNGTIPASPSAPTVKIGSNCVSGSCLFFDGGDYVDCGTNSVLNPITAITISAWFKRGEISGGTYAYTIVRKGGQTNTTLDYFLGFGTSNKIGFSASKTTSSITGISDVNQITSLTDWYYVVGTFDGINYKLYINGIQTGAEVVAISNTSVSNLYIGQKSDNTQRFNGSIDDIRIYNAAMPASQIKEQYYSGLNNLLSSGSITQEEYSQRLNGLAEK